MIVTNDVPSKHVELKKALFAKGYKDRIKGTTCETIYFPNTTLYHVSKTAAQAIDDVKQVCDQLNIKLERGVATIWDNWSARCGEPFGS